MKGSDHIQRPRFPTGMPLHLFGDPDTDFRMTGRAGVTTAPRAFQAA
jgi:hypothetical protein